MDSTKPTVKPSFKPSFKPTAKPSVKPSKAPTLTPTRKPTRVPSIQPTDRPTARPTGRPTSHPTVAPTARPTSRPTSRPTLRPTSHPSPRPSVAPSEPPKSSHSSKKKLGPASTAGIVISVVAVVFFIGLYLYRTHYQYLRRFIKVNLKVDIAKYSFLRDPNEKKSTISRNNLDDEGDDVELLARDRRTSSDHVSSKDTGNVSNPLHSSESSRDRENSDASAYHKISSLGITIAGYLLKQTTNMQHNWVRRWFFVKDGYLYYSRTHNDVIAPPTESPKEEKVITAVLVANLMISTVKEINEVEFHIVSPGTRGVGTGGGVYCLQAESEQDAKDWIRVIRQQIETYLTKSLPSSKSQNDNNTTLGNHHNSSGSSSQIMGIDLLTGENVDNRNPLIPTSSVLFVPTEDMLSQLYEANPYCADCQKPHPEWASINLCIMICIDCAGVHRKLGAHVSKVRSLKLDKWSLNLIDLLTIIGNKHANELWLGIPSARRPQLLDLNASSKEREEYIRRKYEDHAFFSVKNVNSVEMQYNFLLAARSGDLVGLMKALIYGVDVDFTIQLMKEEVSESQSSGGLLSMNILPSSSTAPTSKDISSIPINNHSHTDTIKGHSEMVHKLLSTKGSVEEVPIVAGNLLDMTGLMLSCQHGHILCVELLLLWQANVPFRNAQGLTARDVITLTEPARSEIMQILSTSYEANKVWSSS
eukprot:scaffold487_cov178-Ochromonas_danica.AAC.35